MAASAIAGALVGAGATAMAASRRPGRVAMGAVLWAGVGAGGDAAIDAVRAWRQRERERVVEMERLWQALGPSARVEVWAQLGAPAQPIPPRPTPDALTALRRVAAAHGITASEGVGGHGGGGAAAQVPDAGVSGSGGSGSGGSGFDWSWLPIHVGASADELRLKRLRKRLAEIDEVLARGEGGVGGGVGGGGAAAAATDASQSAAGGGSTGRPLR